MKVAALTRWIFAVGLCVFAAPGAQAADPLDDLIEPVDGKSACFTRVYDAEHLRRHPKQKTASVMVWLSYGPRGGNDPVVVLHVALGLVQRGEAAALYSEGGCDFDANASGHVCMQSAEPDVLRAVSAQKGGSLILDRGKDRDTLLLFLDDDSLTMVKRADPSKLIDVHFGTDDRVFLLRRADMTACAAVEEAVTTPKSGVRQRRPARR